MRKLVRFVLRLVMFVSMFAIGKKLSAETERESIFPSTYVEKGSVGLQIYTIKIEDRDHHMAGAFFGWRARPDITLGLGADSSMTTGELGKERVVKDMGLYSFGAYGGYDAYSYRIVTFVTELGFGAGRFGYRGRFNDPNDDVWRDYGFRYGEARLLTLVHVSPVLDTGITLAYRRTSLNDYHGAGIAKDSLSGAYYGLVVRRIF